MCPLILASTWQTAKTLGRAIDEVLPSSAVVSTAYWLCHDVPEPSAHARTRTAYAATCSLPYSSMPTRLSPFSQMFIEMASH